MHAILSAAVVASLAAAASSQVPTEVGKTETPDAIEKPKYPGAPTPKAKPFVVRSGNIDRPESAGKTSGEAAGVIRIRAYGKPATVAPGGSGTLMLVFAPAGDALMLDPAPVTFSFLAVQDGIEFPGRPVFQPSTPNARASKLKGLKVYADTAVAEVPFRVSEGATPGIHAVTFKAAYELIAGPNGGMLGPYTDQVTAEVEIVAPTATVSPTTQGAPAAGRASPEPATALPVHAGPQATTPSAPESAPAVHGGDSSVLLGAGAGLLGLLAVLALRRRRA